MPVTLQIVNHLATLWPQNAVCSSEELFKAACPKQYRRSKRLVQSSFSRRQFRDSRISPSKNGFVWAAYHAYSDHHHLVIRPEDIWFAIIAQLSFYINRHAEELRNLFVAHDGQKHLEIEVNYSDFELVAIEMTKLIAKNVVDPELRDWVLPSFSTTTHTDKVVGAILFMGAMQKYFSYGCSVACGLPSVTLLGQIEDWGKILNRIDKIELLGDEATVFAQMLRPIVTHMIRSFEEPQSFEVVEFWNKIIHRHSRGSGTDYLTGWITAFCFWDEDGKAKYLPGGNYMFGQVRFPTVDIDKIPAGYASVPIRVTDMGDPYMATMLAGSVGIAATSGGGSTVGVEGTEESEAPAPAQVLHNTVQPLSGWWVWEDEDGEAAASQDSGKARLRDKLKPLPRVEFDENGNRVPFHEQKRLKIYSRIHELEAI
jgi:hypothetical protein